MRDLVKKNLHRSFHAPLTPIIVRCHERVNTLDAHVLVFTCLFINFIPSLKEPAFKRDNNLLIINSAASANVLAICENGAVDGCCLKPRRFAYVCVRVCVQTDS